MSENSDIIKQSELIGKQLTQFRLERGYTQEDISKAIGVAQNTYASYETGKHEPNIQTLIKLADIFNTSLDIISGRYPRSSMGTKTKCEEVIYSFNNPKQFNDSPDKQIAFVKLNDDIEAKDLEIIPHDDGISIIRKYGGKYNRVKTNKPRNKK